MNIIKILPQEEAQKIAAGEVVERPASAVKELIENSIDSGATQITIYIEKAGKTLIRIIDNGSGMSHEDAMLCFHPHATSKLTSVDELNSINSFGFRGEALGSIASISKVDLTTKQKNNNLGIKFNYINGIFSKEEAIACNVGTNLCIQELFYNTPARKKFLKSDETEWNKIESLINAFCLSHLNISFKLYKDNKLILNTPAVIELQDRVSQVFGHNFLSNLIPIKTITPLIKIYGLISNHQFWNYNKNNIFFFVNNRFIKNSKLGSALIKGYLNVLPPDKFPTGIMFIDVDKTSIDINIHPRKEEIQFSKPLIVETQLKLAVKEALEQNASKAIKSNIGEVKHFNFDAQPFNEPILYNIEDIKVLPNTQVEIPILYNKETIVEPDIKIIGQILQTYILIEQEDSLVIIDQHAAHERILYEQFESKFEQLDGTHLMFPELLTLSPKHFNLVIQETSLFKQLGIEIEAFGENELVIKTAPPKLNSQSITELLIEAAHFMEDHEALPIEIFRKKITEHMHSHMACKAAVKSGDILVQKEMLNLVIQLKKTNNKFICVHGRPTMWVITQNELEKKFQRKL